MALEPAAIELIERHKRTDDNCLFPLSDIFGRMIRYSSLRTKFDVVLKAVGEKAGIDNIMFSMSTNTWNKLVRDNKLNDISCLY